MKLRNIYEKYGENYGEIISFGGMLSLFVGSHWGYNDMENIGVTLILAGFGLTIEKNKRKNLEKRIEELERKVENKEG